VVAASAAAAFAAAEAARLGTPEAIAEAQRLLAIAIAAAQAAYQTALDNGAVPPDTSTTTGSGAPYGPPNPSVGQGGGGTCTRFSVSPC
jgi:predicted phage gp36 major capsid-like protein